MAEMARTPHFRPPRPCRVVFVALPHVQLLDIVGPLEAFDVATRVPEHAGRPPFYALEVVSTAPRVRTSSGLEIFAAPLGKAARADTVIVGGYLAMAERPLP